MENTLEVRNKKVIYMNNHQLINDTFNDVTEFRGFLIAYNSNHLVIINPRGDLILSEEGTVYQVCDDGKYISIRKDNVMGVYRYDGKLIVPFEFYATFIVDGNEFLVKKNKGDKFLPYKQP